MLRRDSVGVVRLAFDATPLLGAPTGVGSFARGLLAALAPMEVAPVAYALSWSGRRDLAARVPAGVAVAGRPMAAGVLMSLWRSRSWPPIEAWTGGVDVVHGTNFVVPPSRRARRVVTVHDLTALRHPEMCTATTLRYPALIRQAVRTDAVVHTPSHAVADEVRDAFDVEPDRVVAIHNGFDGGSGGDGDRGRRLAGASQYLLAVGTIEPRKDHVSLVEAFGIVASRLPDLHLVIAGGRGWGAEAVDAAIAACVARDRIHLIGFVDDDARADLLAGASALAYPSRYEGFGLPPLEAMSAGVPVVASDLPVLREVLGDAAELVAPGKPDALADSIERVVADDRIRARLVEAGKERVQRYSWDRCAEEMVALYRTVRP